MTYDPIVGSVTRASILSMFHFAWWKTRYLGYWLSIDVCSCNAYRIFLTLNLLTVRRNFRILEEIHLHNARLVP